MTATINKKPGGAQRIDYSEAERLLRQGITQREVGERFGVTQAAIADAIRRGRIKFEYVNQPKDRAMPWRVKPEHQQKYLARMLRAAHRQEQGLTNAPPIARMLKSFLESAERDDFVVTYEPDTEDGFFRVTRRPGVDDLPLVRRDDLKDDGTPVKKSRKT